MGGKDVFAKFLNTKVKSLRGVDFSHNGNPVSKYDMLNTSGVDYQGQVSGGYGEAGIEVKASAKIDLLDFLAPGIPGLSLEAEANAGVKFSKETLVLLQRFPNKVYASRVQLPLSAGQKLPPTIWDTGTPIALLTLDGQMLAWEFSISGSAGLEIPLSVDELGSSLSASASGKIKGKVVRLRDLFPGSYPSPSDENLIKAQALRSTLEKMLGGQSKKEVKTEVDAWIEGMINSWLQEVNPTPAAPPSSSTSRLNKTKDFLKNKVYQIAGEAQNAIREAAIDQLASEIEATLNKYVFSKIKTQFSAPLIKKVLDKWNDPGLKTKGLLTRLVDPQDGLRTVIQNSGADAPTKKAALAQLETYVNLLQRLNQRTNTSSPTFKVDLSARNYLNYAHLFSFAASADAGAGANASGGISREVDKPAVPGLIANYLPDSGVSLSFNIDAQASLSGAAQLVSYRLQSSCYNGGAPMVFTQDTWVTYRWFEANAALEAQLELTTSELQKQQNLEGANVVSYNAMTYQSIGRYWLHPIMGNESAVVKPGNGSGLCFGMSVASLRLIKYAKSPNSSPKLLQSLAKQLRVPIAVISKFLKKTPIADIDPLQDGFPSEVFLESSFAFPDDTRITLKKKTTKSKAASGAAQTIAYYDPEDGFADPAIKTFRTQLENNSATASGTNSSTPPSLVAIRLRFRIQDEVSATEPLFQLGFSALKSAFNLDISKARGAGLTGAFDYHVEWYNGPKPDPNNPAPPISDAEKQENAVPPVVFLNQ